MPSGPAENRRGPDAGRRANPPRRIVRPGLDARIAQWKSGGAVTLAIRNLDPKRDRRGVEAIDTAFQTDVVFDLVTSERRIDLVERRLAEPITKRYEISEVFAPWASWEVGWVAEDTAIRGFAAVEYEEWHQRLILWFLYISPAWRRRGVGRALLAEVEAHGRRIGASHVWLETSNINVPGFAAYQRLGYTLCGADRLYYGDYMPGETGLYLAKSLEPSG